LRPISQGASASRPHVHTVISVFVDMIVLAELLVLG